MAAYEEVLRLEPAYPLPMLPSVGVFLPGLPRESHDSRDKGRLIAVRDAMTRYFQAWNTYDAEALLKISALVTLEEAQAVLTHLAYTELHGVQIILVDVDALYMGARLAVLDARLDMSDIAVPVSYLLVLDGRAWKVAGRATLLPADPEGGVYQVAPIRHSGYPLRICLHCW